MTAANGKATLAEALVAFQADAPQIRKDAINPHFKNRYASLDSIMDAVRPVLCKHGLAISQHPSTVLTNTGEAIPALRTILLHKSGEQLDSTMPLAADKPGPQAQGSALTYARRYAVLSVLGLVADEDDDATAASKPAAKAETKFKAPTEKNGNLTPEQKKRLEELTTSLIADGHITVEQLTAAQNGAKPADLLARLERYAAQVAS